MLFVIIIRCCKTKPPKTQCLKAMINYVLFDVASCGSGIQGQLAVCFLVRLQRICNPGPFTGCKGCKARTSVVWRLHRLEDSLPRWLTCVVSRSAPPVDSGPIPLRVGQSVWLGLPHIMVSGFQRWTSWHWEREKERSRRRRRRRGREGWGDQEEAVSVSFLMT